MSSGDHLARALEQLGPVELPVATFIEAKDDGTVQVDFGAGPVTVYSAGSFEPLPGTSVRCIRVKSGALMVGPARPVSSIGTVTATGSPTITVTTSIGSMQLPYVTSYTPAVFDQVLIDWASGGIVIGKPTAVPSADYTPEAGETSTYTADFRASDSGSYQSGSWWTEDVYCSASNIGAWFYGTAIADTIPDAATIAQAQVYVPEYYNEFPASLATIGLHDLATKTGAPTVTDAVEISAGTGWKTLPIAFGDALKTGTKKGLGTDHGGYHKWRSRTADADSGLLRIEWSI